MRIQIVLHHSLALEAGAPGVTRHLTANLVRRGHVIDTLSFDQLPRWMGERQRMLLFPVAVARHLRRSDSRHSYDVVDAAAGDAWLWASLSRTRRHAALVARSHGLEHRYDSARRAEAARGGLQLSAKYPIYHGGWRLREVALSLGFSDIVIVPNRGDAAFCINELGIPAQKVRVIHHGLADAFIGLSAPRPWSSTSENLRIALIGRYLPMKGSRYASVALSRFLASHPAAEVTFLGTGIPPADLLRQFDMSVRARLHIFTDYRNNELPNLLRGHHILLFPTLSEGFGLAVIEAMACGLAPVVSDVDGPLEVVTDGHDSLVVPRADASAIERALARLATDRALLEGIRRAAHVTAQRFTWSDAVLRTQEAYDEAIASHARSCRS